MSKIVIALGGNALGDTPEEQQKLARQTARAIVDLVEMGHNVIVAHGNGPQVGMIHNAFACAAAEGVIREAIPLPECGAMSQGYIGFHLQNSIQNELNRRKIAKTATTVVTQVLVEASDPAFSCPTKPIGPFYSREEAERLTREKGFDMIEDAGRGYRRVVASPKPVDVIEKDVVTALSAVGQIVITVGGGGIPVISRDGELAAVPAVIDKDFASAKLAELIRADVLIILTAVEYVAIHFGTPQQQALRSMTLSEAQRYVEEGHFAPGSMLPKVLSAMSFAKCGGKAIIASLEKAGEAVRGESGTVITRE